MARLGTLSKDDVCFPSDSLIGTGRYGSVYCCWLKKDSLRQNIWALKIFHFDESQEKKKWQLDHLVQEVAQVHMLHQEKDVFIKVGHLYNENHKLSGFTAEYFKHGSIRVFSAKISSLAGRSLPWLTAQWMLQVSDGFHYLQTRPKGGFLHRNLTVSSVLIDDCLRAKISDFELAKKIGDEAKLSQLTLECEQQMSIAQQLPERFSDVFRLPDVYGDRYLYAVFVLEAFCQLSLTETIGDKVEEFKQQVLNGQHIDYFDRLLEDYCFCNYFDEQSESFIQLKDATKQIVRRMAHQVPEQRPEFAEISELWRQCDEELMETERLLALNILSDEANRAATLRFGSGGLAELSTADIVFPDGSLIGKGSFAECHRCFLKSDQSTTMAVKEFRFDFDSNERKRWLRRHVEKEVKFLHEIGQNNESFVRVLYFISRQDDQLIGYVMEFCRHGSMRHFTKRISTMSSTKPRYPWLIALWLLQVSSGFDFLQNHPNGAILHRDLAVDNVLISDRLHAKIADFGLSKRMVESVSTQQTLEFEKLRGIERRLPETYDDVLRQPDQFGDRYHYAIFVVEAFGMLSLRQSIGDRVEEFKSRVKTGLHIGDFTNLLDQGCFSKVPLVKQDHAFKQLKDAANEVVRRMAVQVPNERATFAQVSELWRRCDQSRMEAEHKHVKIMLGDQASEEVVPTGGQTVSVGPRQTAATGQDRLDSSQPVPQAWPESANQPGTGIQNLPTNSSTTLGSSRPSQNPPYNSNFTITIGEVGDVANFVQPSSSVANCPVSVRQFVPATQGDEVQLLQRKYAEQVAEEPLLRQLCESNEVTSRCGALLDFLGVSAVDQRRMRSQFPGNADMLFQALLQLSRNRLLALSELGEALKKCGCLAGLRILRNWEVDQGWGES